MQTFFVSRVGKCLHRIGGNVVQYSVTFLSENPSISLSTAHVKIVHMHRV